MEKSKFRFQAKNAMLTYARCDLTRDEVLDHFKSMFGDDLDEYLIAMEPHADGDDGDVAYPNHIHAWFSLGRKPNIVNPRAFDIRSFHPNIKSKKKSQAVDYLTNPHGKTKVLDQTPVLNFTVAKSYVSLAEQGDVKGALEEFKARHSKDYIIHYDRVHTAIRKISNISRKRKRTPIEWGLDQFHPVDFDFLSWFNSTKSLWLYGGAGLGKTQFILSHLRTQGLTWLFCCDVNKLNEYEDQDVIFFDDCNFTKFTREQCIHLLDDECESDIRILYKAVTIPAGVKRVFTSNVDIWPDDDTGALTRRIHQVKIQSDLRKHPDY